MFYSFSTKYRLDINHVEQTVGNDLLLINSTWFSANIAEKCKKKIVLTVFGYSAQINKNIVEWIYKFS